MSAIRQQFQLVAGAAAAETAPHAEPNALPLLATAADVRGVVQYLRKKPGGVTINEALDAIKKQVFDPRKVLAYEALGLVVRQGERLKLSPLGHELGRRLAPVAQVFRALLDSQEPYQAVLAWAARQGMEVIVQADVAGFWQEHHPQALAAADERTIEGTVVCFFQLCQAAALGTVVIGKKGQPTRLRVEHEELLAYLATKDARDHKLSTTEEALDEPYTRRAAHDPHAPPAPEALRVLISRGRDAHLAEQVRAALDLADIESRSVERAEDAQTLPVAAALATMHECNAALIIINRADCQANEVCALKEHVRVELSALYALYRGRVACLWERGVAVPAELQPLAAGTFDSREELPWAAVLRLVRAVKQFRRAPDL